jgi:hypothetical protein
MFLILIIMLSIALQVFGQETDTATTATDTAAAKTESIPAPAAPAMNSHEVRRDFSTLLRDSPSELGTILALDPTLLSNEPFLAGYPELARFAAEHPEVRRNPGFYLSEFGVLPKRNVFQAIIDMLAMATVVSVIVFAFMWLVRTTIEQKRWNRLSRIQTEAHNKILDRFGTTNELLEYIKSPAGTKFLESAPIPLHVEKVTEHVPGTRMMWSIQAGVVVVAGAIGMLLVSFRFTNEAAQALFAVGAIAFCVGAGFVASAIVSIVLSRRLGAWETADRADSNPAERS